MAFVAGDTHLVRCEELSHAAEAIAVVVYAGEEHGATGRAGRCRVKIGELDTLRGEAVEVGRVDLRSVGAQIAEAQVVGDDEEHVGPRVVGVLGRCPGARQHEPCHADSRAVLMSSHPSFPLGFRTE
jgi:hypothetical protein